MSTRGRLSAGDCLAEGVIGDVGGHHTQGMRARRCQTPGHGIGYVIELPERRQDALTGRFNHPRICVYYSRDGLMRDVGQGSYVSECRSFHSYPARCLRLPTPRSEHVENA
jgi:hypothetical protein